MLLVLEMGKLRLREIKLSKVSQFRKWVHPGKLSFTSPGVVPQVPHPLVPGQCDFHANSTGIAGVGVRDSQAGMSAPGTYEGA
jgi:hypothetical protein